MLGVPATVRDKLRSVHMVFPSALSGGEGENREWTPMGAHGGTPLRTGVDRIPAPTVQNGITQARGPVSCDGIVGCFTRRHEATKGGGWLRRPHWWRWGSGCGVLQPSLTSFPTAQAMIPSGNPKGILPQSPGLRRPRRYPGYGRKVLPNPEAGCAPQLMVAPPRRYFG